MKQIIVIVKPFVAERVLKALGEKWPTDITVREVHGYGRQKNYLSEYEQNEFSEVFVPKIEICIWAQDEEVAEIERTVTQTARTGRIGDGKVICVDILAQYEIESVKSDSSG